MTYNWELSFTHVIGVFGLVGLLISYRQLLLAQRANRAKLIIDLSNWFTSNNDERKFFYRLDYTELEDSFRFDEKIFPGSSDEHHLDALLYKLSHIGALLRHRAIRVRDIGWLRSIADIVLRNTQVHAYLDWLKTPEQMPSHNSFSDAIYLYERLNGRSMDDTCGVALRRYCRP